MKQVLCIVLLLAVLAPIQVSADPPHMSKLRRGINLSRVFNGHPDWGWDIDFRLEHVQTIYDAGFRTLRIPVYWAVHASEQPPYTIDPAFFKEVDAVVKKALKLNMSVVLNMHYYWEFTSGYQNGVDHEARYLAMWEQIAKHYRWYSKRLYLEPFNEPRGQLTPDYWNELVEKVIVAIRTYDRRHTLIIDTANGASPYYLDELIIPESETNAICSVHIYQPAPFTFQGMLGPEWGTTGIQWPGPPDVPIVPVPEAHDNAWLMKWYNEYNTLPYSENPAGPRPILAALDQIDASDCPVWIGEFGTYEAGDMESRVRWTRFVREEMGKRRLFWAVWDWGSVGAVYDIEAESWHRDLLRALRW